MLHRPDYGRVALNATKANTARMDINRALADQQLLSSTAPCRRLSISYGWLTAHDLSVEHQLPATDHNPATCRLSLVRGKTTKAQEGCLSIVLLLAKLALS